MSFRAGRVAKEGVHRRYHRFMPIRTVDRVLDLDPNELIASGKNLILLDADNTLLPWRTEEIAEEVTIWLDKARAAGLKLCLISNTRNKARLERLSKAMDIPFAVGKFKPSREMYDHALEKFQMKPEQAVMIGDQIFTDVLGANRSGIDAILVRQMHKNEFIGTRLVSRLGEKLIWRKLREAMEEELDDLPIVEPTGFFHRRIVRQFAKFCIVGLTSFAVDYNIRMTLQFQAQSGGELLSEKGGRWLVQHVPFMSGMTPADAFFPVAAAAGAAFAIVNSFIWNRLWTFRIRTREEAGAQFGRFVVVSVGGLVLNVLISASVNHLVQGDPKVSARIATLVATAFVAIWNFTGQRLYAFRPSK
ncbi:MAG: YqeG family HAD IIIA-type phosphatase [Chthonomonas sp.]|nr:YqeG family HAD IIIA-type phosphatase [Chthonomonas sp.]